MQILELHSLTSTQIDDLMALMYELDPEITVTAEMLERAAKAPGTHLFVAVEEAGAGGTDDRRSALRHAQGPTAGSIGQGHIIGCASLCVYESPTGRKASIEDVVVNSVFRGQGIGKALMEHIIDFARRELAPIDIHLTSRPHRIAANELYQSLGFERRETNVYRMMVRRKNK